MKSKIHWRLAAVPFLAFGLQSVRAQTPGAINQVDSTQQRRSLEQSAQLNFEQGDAAPELYPGESDDLGPQSVLKIKPRRQWISGTLDSQLFHTDNMFLERDDAHSTMVLASTAQVALAPTAYQMGSGLVSPRVGYRAQWFDFFQERSENPNLNLYDFNAQTAFADVTWRRDNWTAGAGFDYTRLLSTSDYEEFYAEYAPRWSVERLIPLCSQSTLAVAYEGAYHFTDAPQFNRPVGGDFYSRFDEALDVSLNYAPCPHVIMQPYYRFQYTHFTEGEDRNDYLHSLGLGIYYFFTEQFSLRGFVSYDIRQSNIDLAEYNKLDAGVGVNFNFRF